MPHSGRGSPQGAPLQSWVAVILDSVYLLAKPLLFRLDAETVHDSVVRLLGLAGRAEPATGLLRRLTPATRDPRLATEAFGKTLHGPIGIAAGLDKNAVAAPALVALGFDAIEVGTVTLRPQAGNERPRVFRLPEDGALINRMGFPGQGADRIEPRLRAMRRPEGTLLGVNIGPNKDRVSQGLDAVVEDCAELLCRLGPLADYAVINVSSPNTARLRELQGRDALAALLRRVQTEVKDPPATPLLIKIAPDMSGRELDEAAEVALETGLAGIVATNTTVERPDSLRGRHREETGGLSGRPLAERSREVVRRIYHRTDGRLPIITAGGITSGTDAVAAVAAGATLVQVYTGFIYRGPGMAAAVKREMLAELDRRGAGSLDAVRGSDA